jgi:hypothetical protein
MIPGILPPASSPRFERFIAGFPSAIMPAAMGQLALPVDPRTAAGRHREATLAAAWQISGDYFENCNCSVVCPLSCIEISAAYVELNRRRVRRTARARLRAPNAPTPRYRRRKVPAWDVGHEIPAERLRPLYRRPGAGGRRRCHSPRSGARFRITFPEFRFGLIAPLWL